MREARISYFILLIMLAALGLPRNALAEGAEPSGEIDFIYSQTPDLWNSLYELNSARESVSRLDSALKDRYGKPQEGFSLVRARGYLGKSVFLGARAESLGWGLAEDPVVSRLHGRAALAGELELGFSAELFGRNSRTRVTGVIGSGLGKRSDFASSDYVDGIPIQTEEISIYGADLEQTGESWPSVSGFLTGYTASLRETVFLSSLGSRFQAHRWKFLLYTGNVRSELGNETGRIKTLKSGIGLHAVAGPQPIPQDILPRIWDYTHQTDFLPDRDSLWGVGVDLRLPITLFSNLTGTFGYYGGYWGGAITIDNRQGRETHQPSMTFTLGSWGISTNSSPDYLQEQLWTGSVGWKF